MIALLGWNPKTTQELFTIDEMVQVFDVHQINKSGAVFDMDRLYYFNTEYIKKCDHKRLVALCLDQVLARVAGASCVDGVLHMGEGMSLSLDAFALLVEHMRTKMKTTQEIIPELLMLVAADRSYQLEHFAHEKMKVTIEQVPQALDCAARVLQNMTTTDDFESIKAAFLTEIAAQGFKNGQVLWPLRYALTGSLFSLGAFECLQVLGLDEARKRLAQAQAFVSL